MTLEQAIGGGQHQSGFDKLAMLDNRRFDVRCGRCDERQATCDERATIDASARDKKNSRSAKAIFCQNTASIAYPHGNRA
jgi:phage terminase large subunit GpA-like protein